MNNSVFGKTMENVRKHRDIKLVRTERTRNYLVPEPNDHTTKFFTKKIISKRSEKNPRDTYKQICLFRFSILELSKILMYEFWYDDVKPKYSKKAKLCYMDTDSFIVYIKTDDIYKNIAKDVDTTFDS